MEGGRDMASRVGVRSITRPSEPQGALARRPWPEIGAGLAVVGVMVLGVFFVLSAIIAGWVSDLHGAEAGNLSLQGRVNTYQAWLLPASIAAVATIMLGIGVVLYGIVLRLWARAAGLKMALPALIRSGPNSTMEGGPR